jgi:carbonic anhydrase
MTRTYAADAIPPSEALERLREGNRRFAAGQGSVVGRWHPGLVEGQWPFAVILGCSDSRAPVELVFDQGLGDLFVIRVAGNIIAPSLVGSVEFAVSKFGTRLVVVMGHTKCGAIATTMQVLEDDAAPESSHVRSIVDFIAPHVRHLFPGEGDAEARLLRAVRINALASAEELRSSSPILRKLVETGRVAIVGAVYDLATGVVTFLDP